MIIDSFLFFQEYDMLEFRLRMLYDHVDKFVIVESDTTYSGNKKSYNFWEHEKRYKWAREKIIYHKFSPDVDGLDFGYRPKEYEPDAPQWKVEYQQRNAIIQACKEFNDSTIIMVSDCDEIPSREVVEFRKTNALVYPMSCQQQVSAFNLNYICDIDWRGTTIATLDHARSVSIQGMRDMRNRYSVMPNAGWHLSYFDTPENIKYKIQSFSHAEYNNDDCLSKVDDAVKNGSPIFPGSSAARRADKNEYTDYFLNLAPKDWWHESI